MDTFSKQFIDFTISHQILKFGEFKTKAGRISPYFLSRFNQQWSGPKKTWGILW